MLLLKCCFMSAETVGLKGPGCPPQLSPSSWTLCCVKNLLLLNTKDWTAHAVKEWCPVLLVEYWIVPVHTLVRKKKNSPVKCMTVLAMSAHASFTDLIQFRCNVLLSKAWNMLHFRNGWFDSDRVSFTESLMHFCLQENPHPPSCCQWHL